MKFNPSFNNRLKEGFLYSTNFPMSQWSTPSSGPLAQGEKAEKGQNQGIQGEPVVHSVEWTTSSG